MLRVHRSQACVNRDAGELQYRTDITRLLLRNHHAEKINKGADIALTVRPLSQRQGQR